MPLTETTSFKTKMQKRNRIQIPRLIRWKYKMETSEVFNVTIRLDGSWRNGEEFIAKMRKDGRIEVPKLILELLKGDKPTIAGYTVEVTLGTNEKSSDDD